MAGLSVLPDGIDVPWRPSDCSAIETSAGVGEDRLDPAVADRRAGPDPVAAVRPARLHLTSALAAADKNAPPFGGANSASGALQLLTLLARSMRPRRPSASSVPAVKNSALRGWSSLSLPKAIAHKPRLTSGRPSTSLMVPRNLPLAASNALILPSP